MKSTSLFCLFAALFFSACVNQPKTDQSANAASPETPSVTQDTAGTANIKAVHNNMQGKWASMSEEGLVLEISENQFAKLKDGKLVEQYAFEFHKKCPESCLGNGVSGSFYCFTLTSKGNTNCYMIRALDGENLSYSLIGGQEAFTFIRLNK